jgi:hypothetical protein
MIKTKTYEPPIQTSRFQFNFYKWKKGRETENKIRPFMEKHFDCKFTREDDDLDIDSIDPLNPPPQIFEKLDFRNDEKKIIVEIKGRDITSDKFYDTIITCGKVDEAKQKIEDGYDVYYIFAFKNKCKIVQQPKNVEWRTKITGTFQIPHYLIPIWTMKDFNISK